MRSFSKLIDLIENNLKMLDGVVIKVQYKIHLEKKDYCIEKKIEFDSIFGDFQLLSEMEQMHEVNGDAYFPPLVAAYAVVATLNPSLING